MIVILYCLLIAIVMPFLAKVPLGMAMHKEKGYDNAYPREQQNRLTGFGARANAAHYNCFEALACFSPAALAAIATNTQTEVAITSAVIFIVARVTYLVCYWANYHLLRSISWSVAMGATLVLFVQAMLYLPK